MAANNINTHQARCQIQVLELGGLLAHRPSQVRVSPYSCSPAAGNTNAVLKCRPQQQTLPHADRTWIILVRYWCRETSSTVLLHQEIHRQYQYRVGSVTAA
jgi:hypothetical protein